MNVNEVFPSKYIKASDIGDKSVTVAVCLQFPPDAPGRRCQGVAVALVSDELAVGGHDVQHPLQLALDVATAKFAQQRGKMDRSLLFPDDCEYVFLGEFHDLIQSSGLPVIGT